MKHVFRYGITVPLVAFAVLLANALPSELRYVCYYGAVLSAGGLGGYGPGTVALVLQLGAQVYFHRSPLAALGWGVFAAIGVVATGYGYAVRARLVQVEAEAQEALKGRDDFYLTASYELQVPLATLLLVLKELQTYVRGESATIPLSKRAYAKIQSQVERIYGVTLDLTDFARISSGQLRLNPTEVDLARVVPKVLAHFEEDLQRARSTVKVDLSEDCHAFVDEVRVRQILAHLISNAVKYGRGQPITVSVHTTPHALELSVRDEGEGISEDAKTRIWERFERGTTSTPGLGLGLWIVKNVVQAMHGEIIVHSTLGQGSTFVIVLPRQAQPSTRSGAYPAARVALPGA